MKSMAKFIEACRRANNRENKVKERGKKTIVLASLSTTLQLLANPWGLGAVIDDCLFKPGVFQRLLGSDTVFGIIDKDSLKEVKELPIETGVCRDEFLQSVSTSARPWI
jgi:hypothetical protein